MSAQDQTRRSFLKNSGLAAITLIAGGCNEKLLKNENKPTAKNGIIPAIPFETIDINIGRPTKVALYDGTNVTIELLGIEDVLDSVCGAVRQSKVNLSVDGQKVSVLSCNYNLPKIFGDVKIDCPITKSYYKKAHMDFWGLTKDARLRIWPANSPLLPPGAFGYPLKQELFADQTQIANEPDLIEQVGKEKIYYHTGLDFGGTEKMVEIIAATDGEVVEVGLSEKVGLKDSPLYTCGRKPRKDVVAVVDERGWFYRYAHHSHIDTNLKVGDKIKKGQKIGVMGSEGEAGWSHLHFEIQYRLPSGKWATQNAYPFIWEAYINEFRPKVIAVARPHKVAKLGERVLFDAYNSWAENKNGLIFEWMLSNDSYVKNSTAVRTYNKVGVYSEILRVTDSAGNMDYDFCPVQVFDTANPTIKPPCIHATYWPTMNLKIREPITFTVQSFAKDRIGETWDFGDGSEPAKVMSDGGVNILDTKKYTPGGYASIQHIYTVPGDYIVTAECEDKLGHKGTAHLHVRIAP